MIINCAYCRGKGRGHNSRPCVVCDGAGNVRVSFDDPRECGYCRGSGKGHNSRPCHVCDGLGVVGLKTF